MTKWGNIKESLDIPEVLDNLGIKVTRVDGHEHFASCPLPSHGGEDRNPSFSVNDSKMIYSCFACAGSGTIPSLVMEIEGTTWDEAIDWLTEFSDETAARDDDAFVRQIDSMFDSRQLVNHDEPLPWFNSRAIAPWMNTETDWFSKRGISQETREILRLGFDPEHERRSYSGPAIIIPHFFSSQLCGWQERWLAEDRPVFIGKYTNSSDFPKKTTLYNYDMALSESEVIVVEGTLTVARLVQLGYNAVGTFGASVSPDQWKLLSGFKKVYLGFDNDDAGYNAMQKGINHLDNVTKVWVIDPPQHKKGADLADLTDEEICTFVDNAVPGFTKVG